MSFNLWEEGHDKKVQSTTSKGRQIEVWNAELISNNIDYDGTATGVKRIKPTRKGKTR